MVRQGKTVLKEKRLLSKAEINYINEKMAKQSVKGMVFCYIIFFVVD